MKIEIQSIKIGNFKGIKSLALDFADGLCVRGDNATGKTTIFDAVCWLLFDKDSKGAANSQIKPVDEAGAEVHNLESIVDAVLVVDGKSVQLKKSFKEKWVRKRGSASKTFEGHTISYFVDEVPVPLKEYKVHVSGIVEEGTFKLLTSPYEFAGMHWKKRRALLVEICGDELEISDEDVISSNEKLSCLSEVIETRSIDDARKIVEQRRKAINKELDHIPVRIQEHSHIETPEQPDLDKKAALQAKLASLKDQLANETDTSAIREKELSIREISAKISEIHNAATEDPEKAELETKLRNLESQANQLESRQSGNKYQLEVLAKEKARFDADAANLRAQWHAENSNEFLSDLVCPTCGQEMPEDKIEAARASFNHNKAETLKGITERGKKAANTANDIGKKIAGFEADNNGISIKLKDLGSEMGGIKSKLAAMLPQIDTKAIEGLKSERHAIEQEIAAIKDGSASRKDAIKIDIEEVEDQISTISTQEAAVKADKDRVERIAELEAQEANLAREFEETEGQLHTMDLFTVAKINMVELSINDKFSLATFKMFKDQVNGGIEECCEILCGGVPFGRGLNTGASINAGLDIINTLSNHYGVSAPIFVDNCESVTSVIGTDSQLIKLIVDPEAKTLTQSKE